MLCNRYGVVTQQGKKVDNFVIKVDSNRLSWVPIQNNTTLPLYKLYG